MGDQLCALKAAYLFVQNQPDVDRVIMSMSPGNEMHFLWERFIRDPRGDNTIPPVEVMWDDWNPGDWTARWQAWDWWRNTRQINGMSFDHYREIYLRIHGAQRQGLLCGSERGLGRRNIYEYWWYGQEHHPETCVGSNVYDVEIDHPPHMSVRDVYISPHCKTQGNYTFTFQFWAEVIHKLLDAGVTVTVGIEPSAQFCQDLYNHPLYHHHWGNHRQWMEQVCSHKIISCGNTGTGWLAAACGVPLLTMEPPNSQMPDHRYRECGLRNLVEVVSEPDSDYVARRLIEYVQRRVVMTTGCYDILHAGHVRHLERSRAMGTKLVVALNSDESVRRRKGPMRPINPQSQRKAVLEALRCVDEVRMFEGDDALSLIEVIKPDVLTAGHGYILKDIVGRSMVEGWGGQVVVTCQSDASNEPSTTKIVQRAIRPANVVEVCKIAGAYSVNPFDKLKLMAEEFLRVSSLPGDVVDLGSYRGGSALILRKLAPDKHLHLFDTWEGTPHDDPLCHHKRGEWQASLEDCKSLVGTNESIHYWQGIFPSLSTLDNPFESPYLSGCRFCFVYVDMDTYQSTHDAIEFFWPRLVAGGKMFFDDWKWHACAGVEKAICEVFSEDKLKIFSSQYACVVVKT